MEELGRDLGYYLVTLPTKAKVFLYAIPVVLSANCEYISSTGVITSSRWLNKASYPVKLTSVTLAPIGDHSPPTSPDVTSRPPLFLLLTCVKVVSGLQETGKPFMMEKHVHSSGCHFCHLPVRFLF